MPPMIIQPYVENAIIHGLSKKKDSGKVDIHFYRENNHLTVCIRDNGPGMSAAEAAHIFEPFYTTKDPGKGTGLGLATCHRIIQQHGGLIEVITNPGEGAAFVVRLPATTVE